MNLINFIFTFSFFLSITIPANPTLYYIDSLYESGDYKNSAKILNELYNEDKNNIDIVYRLARSIFLIAEEENNLNRQSDIYYKGFNYAKKALSMNNNNGYANFWYAAYIGKIGLLEGTEQKILNSYEVKQYGMRAIDLVPDYEHSYHLMGRWHYELADLTWFERSIASLVYTTPPEGSYEKAVEFFRKAIEINYNDIRHHFWLANTFRAQGKNSLAKKQFGIVISLKPKNKKDRDMQNESKKYL